MASTELYGKRAAIIRVTMRVFTLMTLDLGSSSSRQGIYTATVPTKVPSTSMGLLIVLGTLEKGIPKLQNQIEASKKPIFTSQQTRIDEASASMSELPIKAYCQGIGQKLRWKVDNGNQNSKGIAQREKMCLLTRPRNFRLIQVTPGYTVLTK
ncbi:uncharacterized protein PAC_05108 [Phialocephala subalpina]|uniref:Uncharacterized protein n=1 Tax=Phialocephala subalpina TaxID=576137 RepID=A0A1L7WR20_9HELO|nr:uncharacterized protein PAC_05108 [Phialocephala subalpina]